MLSKTDKSESFIYKGFIFVPNAGFLNFPSASGAVPVNGFVCSISGGVTPYSPELFRNFYPWSC
mgnify:CR=1 FL=1